jgi:hypothetical protein
MDRQICLLFLWYDVGREKAGFLREKSGFLKEKAGFFKKPTVFLVQNLYTISQTLLFSACLPFVRSEIQLTPQNVYNAPGCKN